MTRALKRIAARRAGRRGGDRPRLCMVVHGGYPPDPRVARAVRVAVAEGYDVDVLATRRPGEPAEEVVEGARVFRLPVAHRRGAGLAGTVSEYVAFTALASLRIAAWTLRRPYDVVHVNNPPDFLVLAAAVPKLFGARVIFDVHDLSPDMFAMRFEGRTGARTADRVLRSIERWAAAFADKVVTVHEPYRRELTGRGVPVEKTAVVMNSLDEGLLPPADGPRPGNGGFRVVYHGTVTPHYGIDLLIDAVAEIAPAVPDVRLEIYGHGDLLPMLRRRAEELGVGERVTLPGRVVPHREVLEQVRSASVGVVPNLPTKLNRFALSSKLFEYVALGVPAVSADLPTIREHFSDEEVLFFRAGDSRALAAALLEVARDPVAASQRARAALRRYEQYRWPVHARRYAEVLSGGDPEP